MDIPGTWTDLMRQGAFEDAWKMSDRVLKEGLNRDYNVLPRHFQSIWDGTPLKGRRVLIRCYHGLGDTIQFIRYAPIVKEIANQVIVWAHPRLLELLNTAEGIDVLLPLHDGVPDILYDTDVEIMELPHIFRTTLTSIPAYIPYLHAEPMILNEEKNVMSVGLVWQAGEWNPERGIPFSLLQQFDSIEGIKIYILQDQAEKAGWKEGFGIHPGKCTLLEHARIIAGLDLMISVDSMPAHLAGALATPVWLMVQAEADWRWMSGRSDSPWYPTMKIYRQQVQGNWDHVLNRIITDLKNLAAENKQQSDKVSLRHKLLTGLTP